MRVSEERYNDDQRHPITQCVRLALVEVQLPMPIVLGEGLDLTLLPLVHDDDQASFGLLLSLALATGADLGERLSALPNRYGLVATDEAARTSEHDHERRGRGGEGPWYTMERRGEQASWVWGVRTKRIDTHLPAPRFPRGPSGPSMLGQTGPLYVGGGNAGGRVVTRQNLKGLRACEVICCCSASPGAWCRPCTLRTLSAERADLDVHRGRGAEGSFRDSRTGRVPKSTVDHPQRPKRMVPGA